MDKGENMGELFALIFVILCYALMAYSTVLCILLGIVIFLIEKSVSIIVAAINYLRTQIKTCIFN